LGLSGFWLHKPERNLQRNFVEKYTHKTKEGLEKERQIQFEKYRAFEDVMILCKKCHKAIGEEMGC